MSGAAERSGDAPVVSINRAAVSPEPKVSIGRIVHYKVSGEVHEGPAVNAQGRIRRGDLLPAMVVRIITSDVVNLKVMCDGPYDAWIPGVEHGDRAGEWNWPQRE